MKTSYNWLKSYIPDVPNTKDLYNVLTYHLTEVENMENLESGDVIFDINILPNRAHDLLSHQGIARELSGQLGIKFNDPTEMYKIPESKNTKLEIKIESENCRRYMGRIIRNVKVGPSPDWIVRYLESIGQRSINNIVDATNIVMYDCGQPCHAFDLAKLEGEKIVIKNVNEVCEFPVVGRDKIVVKLETTDLVITDGIKNLALAGVKGGIYSGVNENTTDILLEVANFDPTSVRKTARRLNLLSDSAKRFENDLSPEHTAYAMRELSSLFLDPGMNCPNAIFEDIVDIYPNIQDTKTIIFSTELVNKKLGGFIKNEEIEIILKNYNFKFKHESGLWEVQVPPLRLDLENPIDIVEEIGRIYGYDKLLPVLPKLDSSMQSKDEEYEKITMVRNHFLNMGYREVLTYSFTNSGEVEVLASASDKNFLRTNISEGLKKSYETNKLNAPLLNVDSKELKIFEVGNVFIKDKEYTNVAFIDKNGIQEILIDEYIKNNSLNTHYISANQEDSLGIANKNEIIFKMWSSYPFITRDISVWVDNHEDKDVVFEIIKLQAGDLCKISPKIVDIFEKGDKVSFAFRIVFQSYDRTLTDEEVNNVMENINKQIIEKGFSPR